MGSGAAFSGIPRGTTMTGRTGTLALLALILVLSAAPLFLWSDSTWALWWSNSWGVAAAAATAWKCFDVARRSRSHERRAWTYISLAFAAYCIAQLIWTIYELILKIPAPAPSPADIGYYLCPLLLMVGIWLYRTRTPTLGETLIQLGNLGIIVAAIFLANLILFYETFVASGVFGAGGVLFTYVVIATSAFLFVVFNVGFYLHGRRRLVMMPLLLAVGTLALTDYWATFAMISDVYTSAVFLNSGYLLAFALAYWAAFKQDQLQGASEEGARLRKIEEHAKQWETLLPPIATAVVLIAGVARRDNLSTDLVPYAAAGLLLFVASLALRDWWTHRVEAQLREHTEKSEAQLQESEVRLLEKNRELADANRELSDEMQARMRVQEELRHSQKMEAMGHLTGGVAHDFNNLLAVVLGNLELLSAKLGAQSPEYVLASEATIAAERGAALTQRLLAFSRKQKLRPRPIDVGALLEEMRSILESTLGEAIRLEIDAQEDLWLCMADSAQLENAILNLLINARDAMDAGGRIGIEASNLTLDAAGAATHSDARAGSYVAISVRDSGAGIPAKILPRVFEPFFTTKEVGAGSGLGLSMIYGFATQSGGFVSLESELGLGTEVQICLPRIEAGEDATGAEDLGAIPHGNGELVLLVEDEPMVRRLLASILEGLGYTVTQAEDGAEALAILREDNSVDAILCDVVLPGVYSGPDLIREVARRRPGVKALLISGYASKALERSKAPLENVKLLQKPFKKGELARALRAVLDTK
jgi:signal transduction histidine kinase/CheY-like chemotaxis protein